MIFSSANWSGGSTFKKHYLREKRQEYPPTDENFGLKITEQWDNSKNVVLETRSVCYMYMKLVRRLSHILIIYWFSITYM